MILHRTLPIRTTILVLLTLLASASIGSAQNTCKTNFIFGPYTISPTIPQWEVRSTIVDIFNSRGNLIASYTFTVFLNGKGTTQIKLNNQPYTFEPDTNPLGLYDPKDANTLLQSLCPNAPPIYYPDVRSRATVQASATRVYGQAASQFISADFNGDGIPDNASAGPGSMQVTLYNSNGTTQSPRNYSIPAKYVGEMVAADFNGD